MTYAYRSKYISDKFPIPSGWTSKEFWWAVEKLEKYGNKTSLFDLANSLGVNYAKELRGKVSVEYLIVNIITEGGRKDKIIEAVKGFFRESSGP